MINSIQASSLSTPDLRSLSQSFFTGENWFCYWRASSTLWQSKLEQYRGASPIFVPFLWSHHVTRTVAHGSTAPRVQIDFGQKRNDTNLVELFTLGKTMGLEMVLLLPLGPLPFVAGGGVPAWLCESVTEDANGMQKVATDENGRIHKSYSYYSSKVFKEYLQTLSTLADMLRSRGVELKVYAMSSYYIDPISFKTESYFEDHSNVAKQSFARYFASVKNPDNKQEILEVKATSKDWDIFHQEMKKLYLSSMQETFAGAFQKEMKVLFSDASPWQPLTRLQVTATEKKALTQVKTAWQKNMIPSFILSENRTANQESDLSKLYQATSPHGWLPNLLDPSKENFSDQQQVKPLQLLTILGNEKTFLDVGIKSVLEKQFQGAWVHGDNLSDDLLEQWEDPKIIFLFDMPQMSKYGLNNGDPAFNLVIKMIMRGHQVVLNREALTQAQVQAFELFFAQNQLKKVVVGHYCPLELITIGQAGKLCLFNATEVAQKTIELQQAFWHQVLRLFDLDFVKWDLHPDIETLWLYRSSALSELYYEQVRRVVLRNVLPTEVVMTLPKDKKHVLIKIIDPHGVEVITKPNSLELEFGPNGFVVLDFGFLGETNQE